MLRIDYSKVYLIDGGLHFSAILKNAPEYSECVLASVEETKLCPVAAISELERRVRQHGLLKKGLFFKDDYGTLQSKMDLEKDMHWLMMQAGIEERFTPYSIKHAAITFLLTAGIDEIVINKNARLSQHAHTAVRHYFIGKAGKMCADAISSIASPPERLHGLEVQEEKVEVMGIEKAKEKEVDEIGIMIPDGRLSLCEFPQDVDWSAMTNPFELNRDLDQVIQWTRSPSRTEVEEDYPLFVSVVDAMSASGSKKRSKKQFLLGPEDE
jgi:hypothetical protein